jgi:hypothetical protein
MKRKKGLLTVALALALCFSMAFVVSAEQLPVKETLTDKLTDLSLRFAPGFYEHASGNLHVQINRLDGSLVNELEGWAGSTLALDYKLHTPSQKASFDFLVEAAGETYQGQFFIDGDKVVFTRDILDLVAQVGPAVDLDELPPGLKYLYIRDEHIIGSIWEAFADYRQGRVPQETRELLGFLVEAVPYKYLTLAGGKVTLELDQAGFEDVIYRVLQKVQAEPERFADLAVSVAVANLGTAPTMPEPVDPEQMRADIITGIEAAVAAGTFPGREEISMLAGFIQVKEFIYQSDIIPGGQEHFKAVFELQPAIGATGQVEFGSNVSGGPDSLDGEYTFKLDFTTMGNVKVGAELYADFQYQGPEGASYLKMAVDARDLTTGEVLFNLRVTGEGTDRITPEVTVSTPLLTDDNSMDLDLLAPLFHTDPLVKEGFISMRIGEKSYTVNGVEKQLDVPPYIKDGRTMVPLRFVAEGLGDEVEFVSATNEVRIIHDELLAISMYIGKKVYTVGGIHEPLGIHESLWEGQLDVPPYIKDGRTVVPLRFIAEALGAEVAFEATTNEVYIYTLGY